MLSFIGVRTPKIAVRKTGIKPLEEVTRTKPRTLFPTYSICEAISQSGIPPATIPSDFCTTHSRVRVSRTPR